MLLFYFVCLKVKYRRSKTEAKINKYKDL